MSLVGRRARDASLVGLAVSDPFAEAVEKGRHSGFPGGGIRGEVQGEVEKSEGHEGAVGATDVFLGSDGHAEAAGGLFDGAEPVPEGSAVDDVEGVDGCEGEDGGVGSGAVGELAVAAAETSRGVLQRAEGVDEGFSVGGDVLVEKGEAGEGPVEEPGAGGVGEDVGCREGQEGVVEEFDVCGAMEVRDVVGVEGEVELEWVEEEGKAL